MLTQTVNKTRALEDRFAVRVGDKTYTPEFQTFRAYHKGWQSVLKSMHANGHAVCLCPGRGEKRLKICHMGGSGLFYLSKFPNTGEEHAVACQFYAPAPDKSGLQGYQVGVIEHLGDGDIRVRLQKGLRQATSGEPQSSSKHAGSGVVSRDAVTMLGLLNLLWSEAGLNRWYSKMAGNRTAGRIGYWLLQQAHKVRTSRMTLSDVLLIHAKPGHHEEQRNRTVTNGAKTKGLRVVAIDALARFNAEKYPMPLTRLPMSGPAGMPFSYISPDLWARVESRFGRAVNAWRKGRKVIAIAQIEVKDSRGNSGQVCDLALMVVSNEWIPVESSYEALIEQALREQGRAFLKPLRYDADEDCVFPDFWLLDVGCDFPIEVFGMDTLKYLDRKAAKESYYNQKYGPSGWWQWDVTQQPNLDQIPAFPDKA